MSKTVVILTLVGTLLKGLIEFFTPSKRREMYELKRDKQTRLALEIAEANFHLLDEFINFLRSENLPEGFERLREWKSFLAKIYKNKKLFFKYE